MRLPHKGIINMLRNKLAEPFVDEKGVVLAAVLIFISLILPLTLIILNTVEIETMLPTNEGYSKIALHESDKGFDIAIAALLEDNQTGFYGDYIVDPTRPVPPMFPIEMGPNDAYWVPGMARGRHDIDYLAESWARHPDNFTYFMAEHSRENEELDDPPFNENPPGNPDEYSVPTRWIMMNVPFGMDDHGERAINEDYNTLSDILVSMDPVGGINDVTPINAYAADDADEEQAPPVYVTEDWIMSSSHPDYTGPKYIARPASYFRNTNPSNAAGRDIFNNDVEDALVYDGRLDDIDEDGNFGQDDKNQYLNNPILQEAVLDSQWSNLHFGAGNAPLRNKEYKPLPGSVTQYPVGSSGDDYLPAWFQSIVSDESARFNLNTILNIIYQGANYDYSSDDASIEVPLIKYDYFGISMGAWEGMTDENENHPNRSNYLLARDMVTALLMEDRELTSLARFNLAQQKADWILRNMCTIRERLDLHYDADSDGYPDLVDMIYPDDPSTIIIDDAQMNGRGRMGNAVRATQGTWQIYNNPKDFLNDPGRHSYNSPNFMPLEISDFETLNRTCTVYSYDTEHTADAEASDYFSDHQDYRINFNELNEDDSVVNTLFKSTLIGSERTSSLFRWRDGLVDLNADGDLNDEYILQPVKDPLTVSDPDTNMTADSQPVSQITYRERDHFNFQDPANPEYPSMLNVPDLGSLAMIPMSVRSTQIIASVNGAGLSTFSPAVPGPGDPIVDTDDGLSCDIDSSGTAVMFDTLNALEDIYRIEIPHGENLAQMNGAEGFHPSLNSDGTQFVYVDKDVGMGDYTLSIYDIPSGAQVSTGWNASIDLAVMNVPLGPGGDFFQAPSPDWSPTANVIAFAGGGELDFSGALLTEHTDIYTVRLDGPTAGIPDNITNLPDGFYALYPDFSPDGEWVAYTLINFHALFPVPNGDAFMIIMQNLVDNRREVVLSDPGLIMLAPDWDPYGNRLCFMGIPIFGGASDLYTVTRGGTNLTNITITGDAELFPSWGWDMTVVAEQGNMDPGGSRGTPVPGYPAVGIKPIDTDAWDENTREELAQVLQNASLAFRDSLDAGEDQNWRYMDLPVMPQHMVDPLQMCADVLCFRPAYTPNFPGEDEFTFMPQAYAGKVNINTAPRSVLRAIFLLMFQGAVYQDANNDYHGSAPMIEGNVSMNAEPINLAYDGTTNVERLYALAIADTYAHQVDEYRRWIYNNRSKSFDIDCYDNNSHTFSITRETVPNNLTFPVKDDKNYRANPFAPYDLDDNPFTKDRPLYDPEPPFRNIADLFNVSLYNGELDANWLLEGYYNDYGPDPEETVDGRNVVPTAFDLLNDSQGSFGDVYIGANALAVWGPIYQTEFPVTFGLTGLAGDETLSPYETGENSPVKDPENIYYKQQRFRLFSADDFKWISPYITTRSYVYRIESRGTVRVANGTNKLDVSRDKFWIVDFGENNYYTYETTGWENEVDNIEIMDQRTRMNNTSNQPYAIKAFEEVPVDGIRLTRGSFTPPRT